ncbi:hypothetical protein KAJ38_01275 [Candidatus Pacearchaeota archaeon]|nr:hypothetical protein [Candidatus Pacearchaeota archaeon]
MKKLLVVLIGLLCLTFVSALDVSEQYNNDVIVRDIDNHIDLTLTVTNASSGIYNVYTLADVSIKPSETFTITDGTIEKTFTVTATENLDVEGYYTFTYTLNYRGVEKIDKKFTINLLNLEDVLEISSDSIDPESDKITFYIQNKENVDLKNLTATFSSILFDIERSFDIGPKERLEISVDVDKDKLKKTKAGVYVIQSTFQTNKGTRKVSGNLYLGEKKGILSMEDKSGFLIITETITKVNSGNVLEGVEIKLKRNIFSRLFTSFNIEPTITDRQGLVIEYTWIKEQLKPAEIYTVKAKTNYLFPFFTILFAVLALLGFKQFSETKIEVTKSVSHVKTKNGEFALKISLSLKAKKNVENVTLIDKVPAIVKIYKNFGMAKPDKIDTESRRISWNLGDLNAGEERIFTYIVYSKVGVIGKFALPGALVVFEENDQIHEVESNQVFFMSDQIKGN